MASTRGKSRLIRQWSLITLLAAHPRGLTTREIMRRTGVTRATFYRDREQLLEAGVPIGTETVGGEARYTLWGTTLPPLGPTPLQIAALRLARRALGMDGTAAAAELDTLLADYARTAGAKDTITFAKRPALPPDLLKKLDRAITTQRRTRLRYRSARATTAASRDVDPLGLHCAGGHHYFVAYDDNRAKFVTFKLERITAVELLADKARPHPDYDAHALFARSAKVWNGDETAIAVRLSASVAHLAAEYPVIADQTVMQEPSGALVVRARVAGIVEATRWVLSWGKNAEALEPLALRESVAAEVQGAAAQYGVRRNAVKKPAKAGVERRSEAG